MKVLVLGGVGGSLVNFRGPLLQSMAAAGHSVVGVGQPDTSNLEAKLAAKGARFVPLALSRAGLNPLVDVASFARMLRLIRREKPDVVLAYTIKPVIYGSFAASLAGVPRIYALITGLGAAFHTSGMKGRALRVMAVCLYRLALRRCTKVIAQNKDIADLFIREAIVTEDKISVVPGSGVDTTHFAFSPVPEGRPVFLYLGRLLRDKGISELVAASRLLKTCHPEAKVLLVGDIDPNPASLSAAEVAAWQCEGIIEHIRYQADVRSYLRECTAFVLPSYHEGLPRSVLEAMATGRPVITTNAIGCRETVINPGPSDAEGVRTGENGLIVPVRTVQPLAQAMLRLAGNPEMCARLGRRGRQIAQQRFDVHHINRLMLSAMDLAGPVGDSRE